MDFIELGAEEHKHFVLDIRDTRGNLGAVEAAARTSRGRTLTSSTRFPHLSVSQRNAPR
jgi:hypothetical protein